MASRIQSLGQANTILFSREICDMIRNHPEFKSISLGLFEFKNVDEPMEVFALTNEGLDVPVRGNMKGKLNTKSIINKISKRKKWVVAALFFLLAFGAFFIYQKFINPSKLFAGEKSIAVLPFRNESDDKEQNESFCNGVMVEILKNLTWMNELQPIAPQSVEKYRDTKLSIQEIAKELGVKYIVQGTVQRYGNEVKVSASLINARGQQIWANDFTGKMENIFPLQKDIAQKIASALQVTITPEEQSRIGRVATENTKALDYYYDAQMSYVKYAYAIDPGDSEYKKIKNLCNKALALDPNLAEAYVLKARAYWIANVDKEMFSKNFMDSVAFFCRKALALDKNAVDAHVLLSNYYQRTGKIELAFQELNKTITISPNNFSANGALGVLYSYSLYYDPEKSIRYLRKELKLDPISIWTPMVYNDLAFTYLGICDFDRAKYYATMALQLDNKTNATTTALYHLVIINNYLGNADAALAFGKEWLKLDKDALYHMAETYCYLKNDCEKAVTLYEQLWKVEPNHGNIHRWAVALWKTGKKEQALKLMNQSIQRYKKLDSLGRFDFDTYDMAGVYAFLGDKKNAYKILKKAEKKEHWAWGMPYLIKIDPLFDNLRNDKEFQNMVQKALDQKAKLRKRIQMLEDKNEL